MNNKTKFYIFVLVVIVIVLSFLLVGRYNQKAHKAVSDLDNERYLRITAEENLEKSNLRIKTLEADLAKIQNRIKGLEKSLDQTQAINSDLKVRLDKASEVKKSLESKVKELETLTTTPALPEVQSTSADSGTNGS